MQAKILALCGKTVFYLYLALTIVTPLIFSTKNSELFEVPKMLFVYFFAVLILFSTFFKFVLAGKIQIPKSWPLLALIIFLGVQIISTFFSMDKFTSVFGYPSRLNGGLLSQFSFLIIFAGILVNFSKDEAKKILVALVISGLAVSLWGIPGHFGFDPSCLVMTGKLNAACWQKEFDPTIRIFSTLGQPNWLASYLILILPLSIALALTSEKRNLKFFFLATSIILFSALIMTNSRAGILGLGIGLVIFLAWSFGQVRKKLPIVASLALGFLIITALFGGFLFSRIGEISTGNKKPETGNSKRVDSSLPVSSGGTESSQIRLIVWQGALKSFLAKPALGWGPETFAYSYYLYRPAAHNNTTEWNFFYNKAHNEFLNYLSTIGVFGTAGFFAFLAISIFAISKSGPPTLAKGVIGGIIGYEASIFFGFSTVTSQLIFFIILGLAMKLSQSGDKYLTFEVSGGKIKLLASVVILLTGLFVLSFPLRLFFADLFYSRAKTLTSIDLSASIYSYQNAVETNPVKNPFYLADYAYTLAGYAADSDDKELSAKFAKTSASLADQAFRLSPNNLIVTRRAANSYLLISQIDPKYRDSAQRYGKKLIKFAPTDPQFYLSYAKIEAGTGQKDAAKQTLEAALKLKPDYEEAKNLLSQIEATSASSVDTGAN